MIVEDERFLLENHCPSCGGTLASTSRLFYEKKAWCAYCEKRYALKIVGYDRNGKEILVVDGEYT